MNPTEYLAEAQALLVASPIIYSFVIVDERLLPTSGYIRIRATLTNKDFLELAEFFIAEDDQCKAIDYRFQWMNEDQSQLRYRWDNTPHFPELPNAPHHVHIGSEDNVESNSSMNISIVLDFIHSKIVSESELS
jgi:hypothetical protein